MTKEEIVRELEKELQTNSALRHRLGIEGAADAVATEADGPVEAVVFEDREGKSWAVAVLEETD